MEASDVLGQLDHQAREHAAWLDLCQELLDLGIDVNEQEPLANAVRKWGEELHQLRLGDPSHDAGALAEKREAYAGQYERGTYPETLRR